MDDLEAALDELIEIDMGSYQVKEAKAKLKALIADQRHDELENAIQQFLFGADNFTQYAHARINQLTKPTLQDVVTGTPSGQGVAQDAPEQYLAVQNEVTNEGEEMNDNEYDVPSLTKLEEAAKPLIKYLAENYHPHVTAIVDATSAEILEGQMVINTKEFLRD